MATTEKIIINFKTAYQIIKDLNLAQKRQKDEITDYDIIVEILYHERVELIDFNEENLDPKKLVSFQTFRNFIVLLRKSFLRKEKNQ